MTSRQGWLTEDGCAKTEPIFAAKNKQQGIHKWIGTSGQRDDIR